jgi:hypothetical protein
MAFAPSHSSLALADEEGAIAVQGSAQGSLNEVPRYLGALQHVIFDPSGQRLFAAGFGQLRAIPLNGQDQPGAEQRAAVPTGFHATAISISPDEAVLAVGAESGYVSLWETTAFDPSSCPYARRTGFGAQHRARRWYFGQRWIGWSKDHRRYVPSTPEAAARLTRLAAAGAEVLPIDAAHEMSLVNAFPNVDWPAASDPVAAAFWKLVQENGLQPTQPANWWQWLWWSSPFELSPGLAQCKNRIRGLRSQMSWTSWRNTIEQPRRSNNSRYVRMRCLRSTSDRADA